MAPTRLSDKSLATAHKWAALTYYRSIPAGHVIEGDEYANHGGTVTRVVRGPAPSDDSKSWSTEVEEGFVRVECGNNFSVTTDERALMVIGRRIKF